MRKPRQKGTIKRFLCSDELFDAIHAAHSSTGRGARNITHHKTHEFYASVTKEVIQMYINLCEPGNLKTSKVCRSLVVKPIISTDINSRYQVDLIDLQSQPDDDFKFILNYQDHLTKFVLLRPFYTKTAMEVAQQVIEIFCVWQPVYFAAR